MYVLCACARVCMYVYTLLNVCILCMCVFMILCIYVSYVYVCVYVCIICTYVCVFVYVCILCMCVYLCMYCMYVSYIQMHVCVFIYVCIVGMYPMYVCVCMYVCVFMYVCVSLYLFFKILKLVTFNEISFRTHGPQAEMEYGTHGKLQTEDNEILLAAHIFITIYIQLNIRTPEKIPCKSGGLVEKLDK